MNLSAYRKDSEQKADEQAAMRLMSQAQEAISVEDGMQRLASRIDVPFEKNGLGVTTISSGWIHMSVTGRYQFCAISIPLKDHAYIRASFSVKEGYSLCRMKPEVQRYACVPYFESQDGEQWKERKPMFYTGDWMECTKSAEKALQIIADMMTFHEKPQELVSERSNQEADEVPIGGIVSLAIAIIAVILYAMMD